MKVKAIKKGFDGEIRNEGDIFDFEGKLGSWMEAIEEPKKRGSKKKKVEPEAEDQE